MWQQRQMGSATHVPSPSLGTSDTVRFANVSGSACVVAGQLQPSAGPARKRRVVADGLAGRVHRHLLEWRGGPAVSWSVVSPPDDCSHDAPALITLSGGCGAARDTLKRVVDAVAGGGGIDPPGKRAAAEFTACRRLMNGELSV